MQSPGQPSPQGDRKDPMPKHKPRRFKPVKRFGNPPGNPASQQQPKQQPPPPEKPTTATVQQSLDQLKQEFAVMIADCARVLAEQFARKTEVLQLRVDALRDSLG
jgi:hypothetical protein